jgi:cell division protein FtsN
LENNALRTQQYQSTIADRSTSTVNYLKTNVVRTQPHQSFVASGNVASGYYIVFGSFVERNNAENFLTRLQSQFSNVVDIGNDNIFGMYRTGIGPYKTKEDAMAQKPADMKNWILKVETTPNSRLVAYFH